MGTLTTELAGLVLVDKPAGITSHDVVSVVRRATQTRCVGHAGTLDPFATGLLVVLVGRGTRLLPFIGGEPKVYDATISFGRETDTDDVTGTVTCEAPAPSREAIDAGIAALTGAIDQMPPAYSAKKVAGTRAYKAARQGKQIALASARITVHRWDVLRQTESELTARITCSGGTYVRALARDLGRLAGSAAHLSALRRLRSGVFDVADAQAVESIRSGDVSVRSLREAIPALTSRELTGAELTRVLHGNPVIDEDFAASRAALVDAHGDLVAIAERSGIELRPKVVLRDA